MGLLIYKRSVNDFNLGVKGYLNGCYSLFQK